MKLFFALLFLCIGNLAIAGLFDNEIKIKDYLCDKKTGRNIYPDIFSIRTFVIKQNSVFQKTETFKNGKVMDATLLQLSNCVILDDRNWKCGGDTWIAPNGKYLTSSSDQVVKGKYFFTESNYLRSDSNLEWKNCTLQID